MSGTAAGVLAVLTHAKLQPDCSTSGLCSLHLSIHLGCVVLQDIKQAFDKTISSLYMSLQSKTLQQHDKAPHLRQLFMRLDFNEHITRERKRKSALAASTQQAKQMLTQQQLQQLNIHSQPQQPRAVGLPRAQH